MYNINNVDIRHVKNLDAIQLTKVLHALITAELKKNDIQGYADVSFNITTGDGGEDGRAKWEEQNPSTHWLKNRFCIFQSKATTLSPQGCYDEITKTGNKITLKNQIDNLVKEKGCYILFTNQTLNSELIDPRVKKIREAIQEAGHENYEEFQIEIYDANKIKDWINEHISVVTLVQKFNDISRPANFRIWEEWEQDHKITYQENEFTNTYIDRIRKSIESSVPIYITGHSGLGKTRLALEAFREIPNQSNTCELQSQVVYYELEVNKSTREIENYINNHSNQAGILVIDNCTIEGYERLKKAIENSSFKLIAIGSETLSDEQSVIRLEKRSQKDIVNDVILLLIDDKFNTIDNIQYLNRLCEGYPSLAILFCQRLNESESFHFDNKSLEEFSKKILFSNEGEQQQKERYWNTIRVCSLFSNFGFPDNDIHSVVSKSRWNELTEEAEMVRSIICKHEDITKDQFHEICREYKKYEIIEKKGSQYMISPKILAINLASNWLQSTSIDTVLDIMEQLKNSSLIHRFTARFKDLNQLEESQEIVNEICGNEGFLGQKHILTTEWGSSIFNHIVEINPKVAQKTLTRVFKEISVDEIKEINQQIRNNIVWSLEKLCYHREIFKEAIKILIYLAKVNQTNDRYHSDTSQSIFYQLFQTHLSGTEATLSERLSIIDHIINKNDDYYNELVIYALGRTFDMRYHRVIGAEQQGSFLPLKTYEPTWYDLLNYWNKAIIILEKFALQNNKNGGLARKMIVHSLPISLKHNFNKIEQIIKNVAKTYNRTWIEAINELKQIVDDSIRRPERLKLSEEIITRISELIEELLPKDIAGLLHTKVKYPSHSWFNRTKNKLEAEQLAEELKQCEENWFEHLHIVLQGQQEQAFNFGKKVGEVHDNVEEILRTSFILLESIPETERNISFIRGLILGSSKNIANTALEIIKSKNDFYRFAFNIICDIAPETLKELDLLFELVGENKLSVAYFSRNFSYRQGLSNLPTEEVICFCDKLSKTYGEEGSWSALNIIQTGYDNTREIEVIFFIKDLIMRSNMLLTKDVNSDNLWIDSVISALDSERDVKFATIILTQILEASKSNYLGTSYGFETIFEILLTDYFDDIWDILGNALINSNEIYRSIADVISQDTNNFSWSDNDHWHLFKNDETNTKILNWIKERKSSANKFANMLAITNVEKSDWHPFTLEFINNFGNDESVLNAIESKMASFGWSGSAVPYYKRQKFLLEKLIEHPFDEVREWAQRLIDYTSKQIKQEKFRDESDFF